MQSPMIKMATCISDKSNYTDLMVCKSGGGYYVGTMYNNPDGYQEPGSRGSDYFPTHAEAQEFLNMLLRAGEDVAKDALRKHP